jgi:glutaredoxin
LTNVLVYSKEGCHLCERVVTVLWKLRSERLFEISVKDITMDSELFERYRNIIPVVTIDGKIRLAGATLANPNTLESVLRKALISPSEQIG